MTFSNYLFNETDFSLVINESTSDLSEKMGTILSALQDIDNDKEQLGSRQIIRMCQTVVSQIRKILHDSWPDTVTEALKTLQKVAVALSKVIDENEDIEDALSGSIGELETSLGKLKKPVNRIGSENAEKEED